eukprot:Sspe_Gene.66138::Locus_39095_Transcript_1_1_Confidence_1.000_Length_1195::g.66138::m.66138
MASVRTDPDFLLTTEDGTPLTQVLDVKECRVDEGRTLCGRQALIYALEADNGQRVIVKRVRREHTEEKTPGPFRDAFVESARREIDFYTNALPIGGGEVAALWPRHFHAWAGPACEDPLDEAFMLVVEDLCPQGFSQDPALSLPRAKRALEALATMHAAYWGKEPDLKQGAFWPVGKRNQCEVDVGKATQHWHAVVEAMRSEATLDPTLGPRIAAKARYLDEELAKTLVTRIHGDAKPHNMFFNDSGRVLSEQVRLIDAQWTGRGNPLSDVANLITCGLQEDLFPQFDSLLEHYERCLEAKLAPEHLAEYRERIRGTWDTCWLDYVRVVVLGLWKGLSPEKIASNKNATGPSMLNRNVAHVVFICKRLGSVLDRLGW